MFMLIYILPLLNYPQLYTSNSPRRLGAHCLLQGALSVPFAAAGVLLGLSAGASPCAEGDALVQLGKTF